ncbi:MAG: Na+/H+ antiporter NhaC family protein [Planctomycetota bacterium]|nr:Na+/H+ antiporter NhaC family protein [Planctomycetota bacterium]
MGRVAAVLAAVAVVASVFLLPEVNPVGLAAQQAGLLLGSEDGDGESEIGKALLDAATPSGVDRHQVVLYGVGLEVIGFEESDLIYPGVARRSLVIGIRNIAAQRGMTLDIVGEHAGNEGRGGATFLLTVAPDTWTLRYSIDDSSEPPILVTREFNPPRRTSVLPPLIAIALAILIRRPLPALFLGVLAGAFLVRRSAGDGLLQTSGGAFADVFSGYFWPELIDPERYMIIGFVVCMLAMVGVMTRSGGIRGVMDAIARLAGTVRSTQIATYLMGLAIFFDDYANTILVGSTMRPLTDRLKIAREKLAYIVDSTAAPVAGLSVFSTWIAFEVSTFSAQLPAAGLVAEDGYSVFLKTLPYRFYCIFALVLVGLVVVLGRDFGPMLSAERRARTTGKLVRDGGHPLVSGKATSMAPAEGITPRSWRAIAPVLTFIGVTLLEIVRSGGGFAMSAGDLFSIQGMTTVLYDGSGSQPLLVGSLAGLIVAALGAVLAGIGRDIPRAAWTTLRSMGIAILILYLAWMIGAVCRDLGTASWLTALVGDAIDPLMLPGALFVLAGFIAFATGSSWSTMSILLPLVVVLAYNLGVNTELAESSVLSGRLLMVMSIGAVLEGAIFGDHCSPISDTTVMSSIASASDHLDHVRTQAPYAVLAMLLALVCGYFPVTYFGLSPFVGIGLGIAALVVILLVFGRRSSSAPTV